MENKMLNILKEKNTHSITENGGLTYNSTMNGIMDLFALGGAYRNRSDDDCIFLFKKAFEEDISYALKCLFYLRDVRGGQGERRFFKVVTSWLAINHTEEMRRNLKYVPEYGRWDDLYAFVDTPLEADAFKTMYHQLALDVQCKTPSLLAKWLKSENTSSTESRMLGTKTRMAFNMSPKQYRKTLSILRERIRVLERLMSENRWDEIEFDKIPSKAGLKYRNAFAKHDIEREKSNKVTYEEFVKDSNTKVNADTLNPADVVHAVTSKFPYYRGNFNRTDVERVALNKYWDNLKDYFNNAVFDGVAVVDTSGSMCGFYGSEKTIAPIDVAISLGMYCAEKCNPNSPWYGHYITFSRTARLVPVEGIDFVDKVRRIYQKNLCENTNIKSIFDLLLSNAIKYNIPNEEMPKNIVIISDMEFDYCAGYYNSDEYRSEMEKIMQVWNSHGYTTPHLIFWNVDARNDNIPMKMKDGITFISGYSAVTYEMLMTGKTGLDLVLEKLNSKRYEVIK